MTKVTIKPSCIIASIECKHSYGRFYDLTMVMDGEVFSIHKQWCLGSLSIGLVDIPDDILDAFKLDRSMYRIVDDWRHLKYCVEQHSDFTVSVRQSMIAI